MLADFFETRPGRTQEFFRILRDLGLLICGPSAALLIEVVDHAPGKHVFMAAIAIYTEAVVTSFVHFVDAIRFWRKWQSRDEPHAYSRRLRGVGMPSFIFPLRETATGIQIISRRSYIFVAILAAIIACAVSLPSIVLAKAATLSRGEDVLLGMSLFVLLVIGTGGNILAGLVFSIERLDQKLVLQLGQKEFEFIIPILYVLWIVFRSVVVVSRVRIHTSSDPRLRALANIYFLPVTTDVAALTQQNRHGQIDAGKMYVNLREHAGFGTVSIDMERGNQEVLLKNVMKLS